MPHRVSADEAKRRLGELIAEAARGEDVVITSGDGSSFRLVPVSSAHARPRFGSAAGLVDLSDDFDAPIPGFDEYAP
ncbi:MAG: type II toxin-antitoxin system prevent-host-death family antitoxin [Bacteroidota bacterium]